MRRLASLNPTVHCIGVTSALGGPGPGPEAAPSVLRGAGFLARLRHNGLSAEWKAWIGPGGRESADALPDLLCELANLCADSIATGNRPLVIGGDHSLAAATWRGMGRALGMAPGLIWLDAHLDAHTPATSPSGNRHGMPLAALFGHGQPAMTQVDGPSLDPARVVLIGVRSYEPTELALLESLGVRIYDMAEVADKGLATVLAEARQGMAGLPWGISLDVDVLDPLAAPGVTTPVPDGLDPAELVAALRGVLRDRHCVALEIMEYSPPHDRDGITARWLLRLADSVAAPDEKTLRRWENGFGAHNYHPLPVVLQSGRGAWLTDVGGRRYLDLMAAYSATSFGHAHPRLLATLAEQAERLAVTSRAFHNDRLPLFLRRLTLLTGYEQALPVNTGLEAVETALKAARKWAHAVKGIPDGQAEIIACRGNFHGRSIAIVGLSSEEQYRAGFGPFPAGLKTVPYGDVAALATAITPNTAAFLVEPIQGEGGIILPPDGYLKACASLCRQHDILLIADEVQTGLGRTGRLLACDHEDVRPDGLILGKALGGGLLPVAAFLADQRVMQVFTPGDHGSTFGGNPLAAAVAMTALDVLEEEDLVNRSRQLGAFLLEGLHALASRCPAIRAVRGRGLFAGIELDPAIADARAVAEELVGHGILTKETHHTVLRLAPPLIISREELAWGLLQIELTLIEFCRHPRQAA